MRASRRRGLPGQSRPRGSYSGCSRGLAAVMPSVTKHTQRQVGISQVNRGGDEVPIDEEEELISIDADAPKNELLVPAMFLTSTV